MNCAYCARPLIFVDGRWFHASIRGEYLWCSNGFPNVSSFSNLQATVEDQQERLL